MEDQDDRYSVSVDVDQDFDQLVCRVSAQLQLGREIDLAEIQQLNPKHATRLLEILPTLKQMASLRPSSLNSAPRGWSGADDLVNGVLGDFRIQREVGRGGMGVVYEAQQISLGRRVALKILPFASVLDPRRMQRFQNEARAAASLHHPHIVPVFSVGCERGVHFYAMQFIDGQSLEKVVQERRRDQSAPTSLAVDVKAELMALVTNRETPSRTLDGNASKSRLDVLSSGTLAPQSLPDPATVPLAKGSTERSKPTSGWAFAVAETVSNVADALHHAHQTGVIHRDIKPANLMFDSSGKIWVTDFGLAHIESSDTLTASGDLLGTLRYMSPEQAGGKAYLVDYRSDIYSLGATLYELLTLEPAFPGRDRKQLLHEILHCEPPSIRKLDHWLPVELEIIVSKAMSKEISERYSTAAELAADLRRYLKNEPIMARQPSYWQRGLKWCQRHIAVVTVVSATAVVLCLAAAVTSFLLWNQAAKLSAALLEAEQSKRAAETMQGQAELAREQEVQARQRAVKLAAEGKALLDFLEENILAASRPEGVEGGQGREISLRAAIDQALPFIDQRFRNQPAIEIDLRRVLGVSYKHLGEFETSREQFRLANELAVKHLGAPHITTLGSFVNLGLAERECGDFGAAEKALNEAWDHLQREFPQHSFTENCLDGRAALDMVQGRHAQAAEKYETVLAARRDRLGMDHSKTLSAQMNLALAYDDLGRLHEAEAMLQHVVAAQNHEFSPGHPETWLAWSALASVEAKLRKLDSATKIRRQLLSEQQAILGDEHIRTLGTRVNLAMVLEDQGQISEAESLLVNAVPILKEKYSKHEFTLTGMNALASILKAQGALEEATKVYLETLTVSNELRGPEHVFTLGVRVNLANCWLAAGKSQQAISAYRQVLRTLKANHPDHEYTQVTLLSLSQAHIGLGQYSAAITPLKELVEKYRDVVPDHHPQLLQPQVRLAHCYLRIDNVAAAQSLLEAALPTLRRDYRGHELLGMAASDLAAIHLDQQQYDMAVKLFSEAYQTRIEELGPSHASTLGVLVNWGLAEWIQGDLNAAAERMEQALPELRKNHPVHPFHGVCLKQLIALYEELERSDQEAELLQEFERWLVKQGGAADPQTFRVRVRQAQRAGDWELAQSLVHDFESALADEPMDFCVAAGLRARLAEMAVQLHPNSSAKLATQNHQVKYWLAQAEKSGAKVASLCQFDPAMRRYFSRIATP
jgi:serine/threonine protein kinase/Tfp pilus assembly protein PilF